MGGRKYFGTDGIRGRVGQGVISADFVLRLGNALGRVLVDQRGQDGRRPIVVIGKDTRISGYMFEAALEAGLVAAGADVQLLGPMPTPAVTIPVINPLFATNQRAVVEVSGTNVPPSPAPTRTP